MLTYIHNQSYVCNTLKHITDSVFCDLLDKTIHEFLEIILTKCISLYTFVQITIVGILSVHFTPYSNLTLSALHVTIVLLSHLVEKVPAQELFSAQSLA